MALFQTNYDSPLMTTALFSFLAVMIYIMPSIVATARRHHQKRKILLLNILAGWTVIGWAGSLVWALMPVLTAHQVKRKKRLDKQRKLEGV